MRTIPTALQASLDTGVTTLCRCWRITRTDGVMLGFTDHDRDIVVDGLTHRAASAQVAGDTTTEAGFAPGSGALSGILDSQSLRETDLAGGLYDEADVIVRLLDWRDPSQHVVLWRGRIGDVRRGEAGFEAELRGPAARLDRTVGRVLQRRCDAALGDQRCQAAISGANFTATSMAASVPAAQRFTAPGLSGFADGWFTHGVLSWTSGANAPAKAVIARHTLSGGVVTLEIEAPPAAAIQIGDGFTITAGCDKRWRTCRDKFANVVNFRGFPMTPGDDWLVGGPAASDRNDGASLWTHRDL